MSRKSLNEVEQYLLQQFLNNGVLDQFNFKELFRNVLNKFQVKYNQNSNEAFKALIVTYLKSINEVIKQYSLEIKIGICELTGITFYCIVRLYDSNSIGTLSQLYNQNELKLFTKILSLIIESEDGIIDFNTIVNGIYDDQNLVKYTNKDIREAIDKYIRDYWLISVGVTNKYALHSRTILELSQYLVEVYKQDVANCKLCKEIAIIGIVCESCGAKMHRHCAKRCYSNQSDCLTCKNPMSDDQLAIIRDPRLSNSQSQTQSKDVKNVTLMETQVNDSYFNGTASKKRNLN